ncbi:hypothetical protein M378DRAFT_158916 [Amanita muscaria Koide BX008]|uniref:Uncharacterized protein n=1 Tax=Amanita muscaria (strain Koide BX008) TaxID=946122 RepID=A0A0C2XE43_AMAMK|nr:hypothetical protein M378DRAFT_158916 [Amanita muscaria Koide BX008]
MGTDKEGVEAIRVPRTKNSTTIPTLMRFHRATQESKCRHTEGIHAAGSGEPVSAERYA